MHHLDALLNNVLNDVNNLRDKIQVKVQAKAVQRVQAKGKVPKVGKAQGGQPLTGSLSRLPADVTAVGSRIMPGRLTPSSA